jgi:hypothetical protein
MERFTTEQRVLVVKTHYKYGECFAETVCKLRAILGRNNAPNESTVRRLIKKFEASGSTADIKTPECSRPSRSRENIAIVQDSVAVSPTKSTAHQTIALLHEKFPGRVLSRNADHNWPARSCNLTPCDFFLWGYMKSQVYENNPQSIPDLQEEIRHVIGYIEEQVCVKVITNFIDRVTTCRASRGGHMPDIVFHT